ncbi:hypothetical protein PIB30_075070 [Stylosanthes scabra]|uniref:Uncharacterized protein n=1 Tax=Stylosanthes scabra TaxID=79078 RepID=A0ABU6RQ70_9FABA|nr:hypothetical protein [Stylosanthes scabra]
MASPTHSQCSRFREGSGKSDSKDVGSKRRPTHNPLFPPVIVVVRSLASPWRSTPSSARGRTSPPPRGRAASPFLGSRSSSWVTFLGTGAPGVPSSTPGSGTTSLSGGWPSRRPPSTPPVELFPDSSEGTQEPSNPSPRTTSSVAPIRKDTRDQVAKQLR